MGSWWRKLVKLYRDARETWRLMRHGREVFEEVVQPAKGRPTVARRRLPPPTNWRVRSWEGTRQKLVYEDTDSDAAKNAFLWIRHAGDRRVILEKQVGQRWVPIDDFDPATAYVDPTA